MPATGADIIAAVDRGNLPEVEAILRHDRAASRLADRTGQTPLRLAAYKGHPDIVRLLLRSGADVMERDEPGATTLHWAAAGGHPQTIEALLEAGADIDAVDGSGFRPVQIARMRGRSDAVEVLRRRGAKDDAAEPAPELPRSRVGATAKAARGSETKSPPSQWTPAQVLGAILFGLVFAAVGAWMCLGAFDVVPHGRVGAPRWVIFAAGLVFLVPGLAWVVGILWSAIARPDKERENAGYTLGVGLVAAIVLTLFAAITTAAAVLSWYPEYARSFRSNIPFLEPWGSRVVWAFAAVIVSAFALLFLTLVAAAGASRISRRFVRR